MLQLVLALEHGLELPPILGTPASITLVGDRRYVGVARDEPHAEEAARHKLRRTPPRRRGLTRDDIRPKILSYASAVQRRETARSVGA